MLEWEREESKTKKMPIIFVGTFLFYDRISGDRISDTGGEDNAPVVKFHNLARNCAGFCARALEFPCESGNCRGV